MDLVRRPHRHVPTSFLSCQARGSIHLHHTKHLSIVHTPSCTPGCSSKSPRSGRHLPHPLQEWRKNSLHSPAWIDRGGFIQTASKGGIGNVPARRGRERQGETRGGKGGHWDAPPRQTWWNDDASHDGRRTGALHERTKASRGRTKRHEADRDADADLRERVLRKRAAGAREQADACPESRGCRRGRSASRRTGRRRTLASQQPLPMARIEAQGQTQGKRTRSGTRRVVRVRYARTEVPLWTWCTTRV